MRTLSIVKNGTVINRIVVPDTWSGAEGEWKPQSDQEIVEDTEAEIGATRVNGKFRKPEEPVVAKKSYTENLVELLVNKKVISLEEAKDL